jgi:hypothetical protein
MIKIKFALFFFVLLLISTSTEGQNTEYQKLQQNLAKGWNTWNINSLLSHVFFPHAFALYQGIKEYEEGFYLKESLNRLKRDIFMNAITQLQVRDLMLRTAINPTIGEPCWE